jgi:hypothetical protein
MLVYPWGHGELAESAGPRLWQRTVMTTIRNHLRKPELRHTPCKIAVASGHGIGKSALIAMVLKWAMDTCVRCKVVVTANTDTQLRTKTWPEVGKWQRLALNGTWFNTTATAVFSTDRTAERDWRADAVPWSENNTEAFAGLHNKGRRILVIYDEASAIDDRIWEVTEGALTDEGTEIIWLAFGNPTRNSGRFRECFRRFRHRWHTKQIDSRQVEGTNKELFVQWEKDYGEESDFFKIRVRGVFPSLSARQFIDAADVDRAFGRHYDRDVYEWAPKIITCDPAWGGDDTLVIAMRQGLTFKILRKMPKNDNDAVVGNIIARYEDEENADAVFIDMGYGTGIVSFGRMLQRDWKLIDFGSASSDPACLNKRSDMWNAARLWLKDGGSIPPDQQLRDDLLSVELVPRPDGKLQLEPKESMRRRGLPSPDCGDALALSFAYPVHQRTELEQVREELADRAEIEALRAGDADYDPYARL